METSLGSIQNAFALIKQQNPQYCQGSIVNCIEESSVVTLSASSQVSTMFSSALPSGTMVTSTASALGVAPSASVSVYLSYTTTGVSFSSSPTIQSSSPTSVAPATELIATELIAAFSVVVFLFVIVLILISAISVCCCLRRKSVIESTAVQGFDNPDYNGKSGIFHNHSDYNVINR